MLSPLGFFLSLSLSSSLAFPGDTPSSVPLRKVFSLLRIPRNLPRSGGVTYAIAQYKEKNTRCGEQSVRSRAKRVKKEVALIWWFRFLDHPRRKTSRSQAPAAGLALHSKLRKSPSNARVIVQEGREDSGNPALFLQSRRKCRHRLWRRNLTSNFPCRGFQLKKNAHLRPRRRAEQDEPREEREHRRFETRRHGGGFGERPRRRRKRREKGRLSSRHLEKNDDK